MPYSSVERRRIKSMLLMLLDSTLNIPAYFARILHADRMPIPPLFCEDSGTVHSMFYDERRDLITGIIFHVIAGVDATIFMLSM